MLLRACNEIFKQVVSSQEQASLMGYLFTLNFIIFPAYSYLFILILKFEIYGLTLSLGLLEVGALTVLLYIYFFKMDPRISQTSMDHHIFHKLPWFFK